MENKYNIHQNIEESFNIKKSEIVDFLEYIDEYCEKNELYAPTKEIILNKDDTAVMYLIWDIYDLHQDIYYIRKGVREAGYDTIHNDFVPKFQQYLDETEPLLEDETHPFKFKVVKWNESRYDNYSNIIVYRDPAIDSIIDYINNEVNDDAAKDLYLGLILHYSVSEMGNWTKRVTFPTIRERKSK